MADDFCPTHGYDYIKWQFGNPIPYCSACEDLREPAAGAADEVEWVFNRPKHGWVCFHCGDVFRTPGEARDHFGWCG